MEVHYFFLALLIIRCLVHLVLVNKVKLIFIQLLATDSQPCSGL